MMWSCALLVLALVMGGRGQDTRHGQQDTLAKPGGQQEQELVRLEQRLRQQVRESERRVLWKLHDKAKRLNASSELRLLHNMYEFQEAQFELFQERAEERERKTAARLSRQDGLLRKQQHQLDSLRSSLDRLSALANPDASSSVTQQPAAATARFPSDCQAVLERGGLSNGLYVMLLQPPHARAPFQGVCHLNDTHGWTVIQRRMDGSVNFFRGWHDYKRGFGKLEGEFWLGLENIHHLTNQGNYLLRIEMETFSGGRYWAEYTHFRVGAESDNFRLHIRGYRGDAGDSLTSRWNNHDGLPFSTKDHDNDHRFHDNCAEKFYGAWWFRSCYESHLNGKYYARGAHKDYFTRSGILWNSIHDHSSLKSVRMMVRPADPDNSIRS